MPFFDLFRKANFENYDKSVAKHIPTYPGALLTAHVLQKNIQLGSTVGSGLGIGWWMVRPRTETLIANAWPRAALIGACAGLPGAAIMMVYKMREIDLEGLEDRAYRLSQNKNSHAIDLCCVTGAIAMLASGMVLRKTPGARRLWPAGFAAQGTALGFFSFAGLQAAGYDCTEDIIKHSPFGWQEDEE